MKKIIRMVLSFVVAASIATTSSLSSFASTPDSSNSSVDITESMVYTFPNGDTVEYYLDLDGNPYHFVDGNIVYLLLPLDHLIIRDEEMLSYLNSKLPVSGNMRSAPTNYIDLSNYTSKKASRTLTKDVSFSSTVQSVTTSTIKLCKEHRYLLAQTENIDKGLFSGNKISITYYMYFYPDDEWWSETFTKDYSEALGYKFYPALTPYAFLKLAPSDNVKSFKLKLWTNAVG